MLYEQFTCIILHVLFVFYCRRIRVVTQRRYDYFYEERYLVHDVVFIKLFNKLIKKY